MFSDATTITFVIIAGVGLIIALILFKAIAVWQRRRQRDARLESAFDRARHQEQSGRGTPHF